MYQTCRKMMMSTLCRKIFSIQNIKTYSGKKNFKFLLNRFCKCGWLVVQNFATNNFVINFFKILKM